MTNSCAAGAAQKNKKNERSTKHKVIAKGLEVGEAWSNVPYYKWRNTKYKRAKILQWKDFLTEIGGIR